MSQYNITALITFLKCQSNMKLACTSSKPFIEVEHWCLFSRYLMKNHLCDRPHQTFFERRDQTKVKQICHGYGWRFSSSSDLCISDSPFQLFDLHIDNNCQIQKLYRNITYVVVACDAIQNVCLPVRFKQTVKYLRKRYGRCPDGEEAYYSDEQ